jgi:hypothetical protein
MKNKELSKFYNHRSNAKKRGIIFLFTFEEWITMWKTSGKWDQRGWGANKYCMARHNDIGPYAPWNVSIITNSDNSKFAVTHRDKNRWMPAIQLARKSKDWRKSISHEGNNQFKGPILGINVITGKQIIVKGKNEINDAGFAHQHVYKCVNGKLKTHKGYTWQRI